MSLEQQNSSRYLDRHATFNHGEEALCDELTNGCIGGQLRAIACNAVCKSKYIFFSLCLFQVAFCDL